MGGPIIFIGMETSGELRRRFHARGIECYSGDFLAADDGGEAMAYSPAGLPLGRHLVGDVFATLDNMRASDRWPAAAIFHPTCTYLTASAEWAFADPDFIRFPGVGYHQRVKPGTLTGGGASGSPATRACRLRDDRGTGHRIQGHRKPRRCDQHGDRAA